MDIAERLNALRGTAHDVGLAAIAEIERLREENQTLRNSQKACADCDAPTVAEIERLRTEHEKLLAVQEAQQRELVIRTHNQTRHLEEVQKLRTEIAALQRLVQNDI